MAGIGRIRRAQELSRRPQPPPRSKRRRWIARSDDAAGRGDACVDCASRAGRTDRVLVRAASHSRRRDRQAGACLALRPRARVTRLCRRRAPSNPIRAATRRRHAQALLRRRRMPVRNEIVMSEEHRSQAGCQVWRQVVTFAAALLMLVLVVACAQDDAARRATMLYGSAGVPPPAASPAATPKPSTPAGQKRRPAVTPQTAGPADAKPQTDTPGTAEPPPREPAPPEPPRDRPAAAGGPAQAALPRRAALAAVAARSHPAHTPASLPTRPTPGASVALAARNRHIARAAGLARRAATTSAAQHTGPPHAVPAWG